MEIKENEYKAFPFICTGESWESEQEAWERFDEQLAENLYWTKGFKYWRVIPTLEKTQDFESLDVIYRIYARILTTKDAIKGWKEVKHGYPYNDAESFAKEDNLIPLGEIPEFKTVA